VITIEPIAVDLPGCDTRNGAVASFLGVVRGSGGVVSIHYDAYEDMAARVIAEIVAEAQSRFDIGDASVIHRIGVVGAGEPSLRAVVRAPHRTAAFDALRWLVDEVKRRVPIWKKEQYEDGTSRWLD
jgi:molybdopterin synthase catalytic subunit